MTKKMDKLEVHGKEITYSSSLTFYVLNLERKTLNAV
jgi:hypothetical protein